LRETRIAVFFILAPLCSPVRAATFVVTSAADSGPGSLRQALLDAPGDLDGDFINFSIGSGVATIRPLSELPVLDFGFIDGTTQPGYVGSPLIEIDGSLLPATATGLRVGSVEVRGLVVNRCAYRGISTTESLTLTRSFIGTDVTGKIARGNGVGVYTTGSGPGIKIGGFNPLDGNVISGNSAYGIVLGPGGGAVRGNRIGTDVTGESPVPNGIGIRVQDSSDVIIGGCCPGESRNVISGNTQFGIELLRSSAVLISRNDIGPSASGGQLGSSQRAGIAVYESSDVAVGGESGQGDQIIAYNSDVGIGIDSGSRRIRLDQNSIFSNGFGIDLDFVLNTSSPRVTPNDPLDADVGANLLQNFPIIDRVNSAHSTRVWGHMNSAPNSTFQLRFYSSPSCGASGYGEGKTVLGLGQVDTDPIGYGTFDVQSTVRLATADVVTVTASDEFGNTSEFSRCEPLGFDFYTREPFRVADTRAPDGPLGGPALQPGQSRSFPVAGKFGVSDWARAIAVNLTVTGPTAPGHLVFYSGGSPIPLASQINFRPGQTRSNNAVLRIGDDGSIVVVNGSAGTVHLILDTSGYFE
jgi:parallel beta helix pectate lyase-like protein